MNYILFQSLSAQKGLQPFSLTRPLSEIRLGILTITQKWEFALKKPVSFLTKSYLQKKYPLIKGDDNLLINGAVLADKNLLKAINVLLPGQIFFSNPVILAARINKKQLNAFKDIEELTKLKRIHTDLPFFKLRRPWEIFKFNGEEIRKMFQLITKGRKISKI